MIYEQYLEITAHKATWDNTKNLIDYLIWAFEEYQNNPMLLMTIGNMRQTGINNDSVTK